MPSRASSDDGDSVLAEGFTHLIPFAAGHEIIRQRKKDLTLCRLTPDLIYDQMVGAGVAEEARLQLGGERRRRVAARDPPGGGERAGSRSRSTPTSASRRGSKRGPRGFPFFRFARTTERISRKSTRGLSPSRCPFTGETLYAVPALNPDVAILHAQRADVSGNTQVWGLTGVQKEAAFAAKKVIVSVEEIVDEDVIRADPNRTMIPGLIVDAVVEEPYGAHPSFAQGYYDRDNDFYVGWEEIGRSEENLKAYLDEWVYGVEGRKEYVEKLGSSVKERLAPEPLYSSAVNYGLYR